MQSVSSRTWTRVAVSNSYDDNHYTTVMMMMIILNNIHFDCIGCLNIHETHVTANNSTNNNIVFFFVSDLKIVYYKNY